MAREIRNIGASVRARLLQLSKASGQSTAIPTGPPDALTPAFAADEQKQKQWRAFVEDVAVDPGPFGAVLNELADFLIPHAT